MNLLKQVGKDITKEVAWILFFAIIASLSLYNIGLYIDGSFKDTLANMESSEKINNSDAVFVRLMTTTYSDDDNPAPKLPPEKVDEHEEIINSFFKKYCSREKRMIGAFYAMGENTQWPEGCFPYKNIYILIGSYAFLTSFDGASEDHLVIACTPDIKGKVGKEKYNGCEITHVLPDNFGIYGPGLYLEEPLQNSLFVFAADYDQLQMVMPDLPFRRIISNMIFVDSTEEDRAEFSNIIYRVARGYASYTTFEEETRLDANYRGMMTSIIIVTVAAIALIGSMLYNTIRTIKRKTAEYTIQHLYGANCLFIFARMFLFIIAYYAPALIIFFILHLLFYPVKTPVIIGLVVIIALLAAIASIVELLNFKRQFSKGIIRRET